MNLTCPKFFTRQQLIDELIQDGWALSAVQAYCRGLPAVMTRLMYEFQKQAFLDAVMLSGENVMAQIGDPGQSKGPKQAKMGRMPVPA